LAARLLDGLIVGMVFVTLGVVALVLFIPHIGPVFPDTLLDGTGDDRVSGFVWLEFLFFAIQGVTVVVGVVYEGWLTAATGRTLGKRWLRIRPVGLDGSPLSTGKSFGRAALHEAAGLLGWAVLVNVLWCLWDAERQCLHDKIANTLVIND
jgi:uncharacterized RDD family membrane protein YckC